ncbi:MAG: helix-turn-helix domain-containing protein [Rickettsiales bacterium]|nr:helix-turn-helix domain-containing protein [Rickettsiales bacterium]
MNNIPKINHLLTRKQAAEFLGVKENTLAVWSCNKRYKLPYIKIGRLIKYRLDDLEAFIENNKKGGQNEQ